MFFKITCAISNFFTKKLHLSIAKILRYYNEWECIKTIANLVFGASNSLEKKSNYTFKKNINISMAAN
jgi:hypothetical protein